MSTSQKDQIKKVIHILGYANQALEQLSPSAYESAIVRAMQQGIERQCIDAWCKNKKMNRYIIQWLPTVDPCQHWVIHAQGEDSEEGQLIYLAQKGSFQVNLYKMIRFLSEIHEIGQNSKNKWNLQPIGLSTKL